MQFAGLGAQAQAHDQCVDVVVAHQSGAVMVELQLGMADNFVQPPAPPSPRPPTG